MSSTIKALVSLIAIGALAVAGFLVSGVYDVGADVPHWKLTERVLEFARERAIARGAAHVEVPALDDPALLAEGAEHYAAMCTGCHLAPDMDDSELRTGLYPRPPNLSRHRHAHGDAAAAVARQFQIIKHGLKMTGMPAWGASHDDRSIWGMVALLQQLPKMTPEQYAELTERAGAHEHGGESDHGGGHQHDTAPAEAEAHDHGDTQEGSGTGHAHADAPGAEAAAPHSHEHAAKAVPPGGVPTGAEAEATPEQVAEAFVQALGSGDAATVQALLLPDALIFESGAAESSAAEYAQHHLPADMAFLAQMQRTAIDRRSGGNESGAWVATRSRTLGTYQGKPVDLDNTETLVLERRDAVWRIAHIHWSSAPHSGGSH